jgi:hypothetical protein
MAHEPWTYETLAQADGATFEAILKTGTPPDPEELNGWIYCGWNHEYIGKLSGEKFKKGFRKYNGMNYGFNELCEQDDQKYLGEWKVRLLNGRPIQLGYFRVNMVKDEQPEPFYKDYPQLATFNYNVDIDTGLNLPIRLIRDLVVLPNPGDHSLMLCKAHIEILHPNLYFFFCYFLLGHRLPIDFEPSYT